MELVLFLLFLDALALQLWKVCTRIVILPHHRRTTQHLSTAQSPRAQTGHQIQQPAYRSVSDGFLCAVTSSFFLAA